MPNMINYYGNHHLVVVKNRLFVIGMQTNYCEMFDNVCRKFVSLKDAPVITYNKCVPIGNKIVLFQKLSSKIICYDVDKDEWSEDSSEVTKGCHDFSCVKLPLL